MKSGNGVAERLIFRCGLEKSPAFATGLRVSARRQLCPGRAASSGLRLTESEHPADRFCLLSLIYPNVGIGHTEVRIPPPEPSPLVHFIRRSCGAVGGARQLGVLSVRFIARRLNERIRNCTWAVERIR